MKPINELTDEQLDYWCAKAQGWHHRLNYIEDPRYWIDEDNLIAYRTNQYRPTTSWQQCGELIEKFGIALQRRGVEWNGNKFKWWATTFKDQYIDQDDQEIDCSDWVLADTPQRAICLACISSVYGEELEE